MSGPYQPPQPEPTPADPTAGQPPAAPDAWTPPPAPQDGTFQYQVPPTQYTPPADATQPQYGAPQYGAPQPQFGAPPPQYPGQFPVPQYTPGQPGQPGDGPTAPAYTPPKAGASGGAKALRIGGAVLVAIVLIVIRVTFHNVGSGSSSSPANHPAPSNPFDQTAASAYPLGEAGIVVPDAAAVTGSTKEQVAAALQQTKKGLVASRLDNTLLVSHDPSALLALLAPDARPSIQKSFDDKDFFSFATELGDGQKLTSDGIRVKGTMSVKTETTSAGIHVLDVVTNFVWVYPFAGTLKDAGDHLVTIHDEVTWGFPLDADVDPTSRGMFITDSNSYAHNMDCAMIKVSLLGLGKPTFSTNTANPAAADRAALDPNSSIDSGVDTCKSPG